MNYAIAVANISDIFAIHKIPLCLDHYNDRKERIGSLLRRRLEWAYRRRSSTFTFRYMVVCTHVTFEAQSVARLYVIATGSTRRSRRRSPTSSSLFTGPDPYVRPRGAAYLDAVINALSAHRLHYDGASLARRRRRRGRGIGIVTRGQRDSPPRPWQSRAEPNSHRSIEKFRVLRASRLLTRAAVRRAVQSRVCTRLCAKFVRRSGTKMLYLVAHECFLHFSRLLKLFSADILRFKL